MSNVKAIIKRTAVSAALLSVYILVLSFFGIHCPFADIIGIQCPTCGVSRATLSFLMLDFESSFNYHPLAIPLVISVWLLINIEYLTHKKMVTGISVSVVTLNFIMYLAKMIGCL